MSASGADTAWRTLLAVVASRRAGTLPAGPVGLEALPDGRLEHLAVEAPRASLIRRADGGFGCGPALDAEARELVELYLPMLAPPAGESYVVAHLGQSVDARIATAAGHSDTVTGHADFVHMHRLRALADAVLVGAGTVAADDPALTTRLVEGESPLRVVLDPRARLAGGRSLFTDGAAPTLLVHAAAEGGGAPRGGDGVERLSVARDGDDLSLPALLAKLRERGVRVLFVEGGGVTVTRWMTAGLLDRLHLAVAPVLVGEGRPALSLPGVSTMDECRRPPCRLYRLGEDVLWDFDLRGGTRAAPADADRSTRPRRLR